MTPENTNFTAASLQRPIYLEDLAVGDRFKSGEHAMSEEQIQPSKSKPDRGMVTVRSETRNQHGEVLQVSTVRIVVPRKPRAGVGAG